VYYEVWAKQGLVELTVEEKKILREDLELGDPNNDFGDMYVAKI